MATDAEIRAKGIKFLPLQKYLQNPYEFPVEEETPPVPGGITNTNAFTGSGGDNFSVYNPDPNSIVNREYRPNYDYRKSVDYDPSLSATANEKQFDMAQNYYNKPPVNPRIENILNRVPYLGPVKKGVKFLSSQISPYLPVSRRSILENELAGQGIMVDDIGRIVRGAGDYDTVGNVMAGYGAGQITQKTIDKRKGTIEKTLADKYNMSVADINAVKAGTYKGEVLNKTDLISRYGALDEFEDTLDLTNTKTDKIFDFEEEEKKKKQKDTIVGRYITNRKEKKAAKEAKETADAKTAATTTAVGGTTTSSGLSAQEQQTLNNAYNAQSQASRNRQDQAGGSGGGQFDGASSKSSYDSDPTSYSGSFAKGGRAGYFFGGRARLQGGGGADMGAPEKSAERASKGYGTTPDTGSKSGTNDYSTAEQTRNNYRSIVKNQNSTPKQSILDKTLNLGSEVNYLKNLYKMDPVGLSIGFGVNKLRTYIKNKNLPEEDKFSYNTNPLPTDNYFAEVKQKDLDASKMKGFKKQDYPSYKDQMDMLGGTTVSPYEFKGLQDGTITTTGTFTAANGGRAMFKNGGLAGLL